MWAPKWSVRREQVERRHQLLHHMSTLLCMSHCPVTSHGCMDSNDLSLCKPSLGQRKAIATSNELCMALLSFPFLNRLAQDLSNHARPPPNLAEQTWTCFGQWQLLPLGQGGGGGEGSQMGWGQGDGGGLLYCREGNRGLLCLNLAAHRSLDSGLKCHSGAVGPVHSLGCQGGGAVSTPL